MNLFRNRNSGRLREIVGILWKYGLAGWLEGLDQEWLRSHAKSVEGERIGDLSKPARIRAAMTELGPTFIKLGQILSTRADLIGPELATELAKLQSNTPADDREAVIATVRDGLGRAPGEAFAKFDVEAFASASIGQVHRATLADGQQVVVKVRHAGIEDRIKGDLEILTELAALAEKHAAELRPYRPVDTIAEFRRILLAELDFSRERRNLHAFARNFADDDTVHIPAPFDACSSKHVLTMEMLGGVSLSKAEELKQRGEDLDEFARRGVNMYLNMVFRDGFYHADPHPGNLMYLPGGVVGLLDCGMVGRIDDQLRDDLEGMLLALLSREPDQLTDTIVRLGSIPQGFDRGRLQADIADFLHEYGSQSIKEFDLSGALNRVTEIIREHRIILPSGCTMLVKTLVMLEGTARKLSPTFSLGEVIQPYAQQIVKRRFSPTRLLRRAQRSYRDWGRMADELPRNVNDILSRMQQGSFDVHLEHRRLDTIANRLVTGLIASALLVGSSLLWAFRAPPVIGDVSLFGLFGAFAAAVIGWRLWRAVRRSGDLDPER